MKTNYLNLKRMFNHILLNVPEENITMRYFRLVNRVSHECKSAGCIIGHCTILDNYENIIKDDIGQIDFIEWSENFTGLTSYTDNWNWCFGGSWLDNKTQILLRLKYFIDNQSVPCDWDIFNYKYILPEQKLEPYDIFL